MSFNRKLFNSLHLKAGPRPYHFELACPMCGKRTHTVVPRLFPPPKMSCGDCLMDRVEVVDLKIVWARPV